MNDYGNGRHRKDRRDIAAGRDSVSEVRMLPPFRWPDNADAEREDSPAATVPALRAGIQYLGGAVVIVELKEFVVWVRQGDVFEEASDTDVMDVIMSVSGNIFDGIRNLVVDFTFTPRAYATLGDGLYYVSDGDGDGLAFAGRTVPVGDGRVLLTIADPETTRCVAARHGIQMLEERS